MLQSVAEIQRWNKLRNYAANEDWSISLLEIINQMNNAKSLLQYYQSLLDCMDIDREQLYVHVSNHIYLNQTLLFEKNLTISEFDRLFYSRWENVDLYSFELIETTSKPGLKFCKRV